MLARLGGFVSGLDEGTSVKPKGYQYPLAYAPVLSVLAVTKLTFSGKDYDLSDTGFKGLGLDPVTA
jgi:hypothetical protein